MKIKRTDLLDAGLPYDGYEASEGEVGVKVLSDTIIEHRRWSILHELIFSWTDGKKYRTSYSEGATELQDERPWEYECEVECEEVEQKLVTILQWVPVNK